MEFLNELKEMILKEYVDRNHVNGDIDKFLKNLKISDEEKKSYIMEAILEDENESTKKYIKKVADISRRLELICKVLNNKKLERNRKDLKKIGIELIEIAKEIIDMGDSEDE